MQVFRPVVGEGEKSSSDQAPHSPKVQNRMMNLRCSLAITSPFAKASRPSEKEYRRKTAERESEMTFQIDSSFAGWRGVSSASSHPPTHTNPTRARATLQGCIAISPARIASA